MPKTRQFIEHAPLLNNSIVRDSKNRHLLDFDASASCFDPPKRAAMCPRRQVATGRPVTRSKHVEHLFAPVWESTSNTLDAKTNASDTVSFRDL
jgi:hypothetical protein